MFEGESARYALLLFWEKAQVNTTLKRRALGSRGGLKEKERTQ